MPELDVRIAAFAWLKQKGADSGGLISGIELQNGFTYEGQRITLKGAAGVWFPKGFSIPISITTRKNGPYPLDGIEDDGLLTYAYQEGDPDNRDNRGLREACRTRTPLI